MHIIFLFIIENINGFLQNSKYFIRKHFTFQQKEHFFMEKLRIGIIGSGYRGTLGDYAHAPADGVEIVAGADIFPEQRTAFLERYRKKYNQEVRVYADYHEMIDEENLDGVFITSPDYCHEEQACCFR